MVGVDGAPHLQTDPPSPQSATDLTTGSSSAAAAHSSSGRVGGALVSPPRLLLFLRVTPFTIPNRLSCFASPRPPLQSRARGGASPPAHLTRSSALAAGHRGPLVGPEPSRFEVPGLFWRALLIVLPEPRPRRCCSGEPGRRPHPPIFCADPASPRPPPPPASASPGHLTQASARAAAERCGCFGGGRCLALARFRVACCSCNGFHTPATAPGGSGLRVLDSFDCFGRERPADTGRCPSLHQHSLAPSCSMIAETILACWNFPCHLLILVRGDYDFG
jgi:hypothetical protein